LPELSVNPFIADPVLRDRYAASSARHGETVAAALWELASIHRDPAANNGGIVTADEAAGLVARFGLASIRELMVLGLLAARRYARPPISDFFVGAIGLEAETGNLLLGGNVEFAGAPLAFTLHGEGFVFTRAFSRGTTISTIAIGEAHPCAHCRQYLAEFGASSGLVLIDPLGHELTLAQLYPWPFDPGYLGEPGIVTGANPWPALAYDEAPAEAEIAERLLPAGRRAHVPYGKCPSAIVLRLRDGSLVAGSAIESVAFNPGIVPLQAALVDLLAHGRSYDEI